MLSKKAADIKEQTVRRVNKYTDHRLIWFLSIHNDIVWGGGGQTKKE